MGLTDNRTSSGYEGGQPKYLTFRIDDRRYGLPLSCVRELDSLGSITGVPGAPGYIKGLANLRGKAIPVMDVRMRLGSGKADYGKHTCYIVVGLDADEVGLVVDETGKIVRIDDRAKLPPEGFAKGAEARFMDGVVVAEGKALYLIDMQKLLYAGDQGE